MKFLLLLSLLYCFCFYNSLVYGEETISTPTANPSTLECAGCTSDGAKCGTSLCFFECDVCKPFTKNPSTPDLSCSGCTQDQTKCGTPNCILECSVCAGLTRMPSASPVKGVLDPCLGCDATTAGSCGTQVCPSTCPVCSNSNQCSGCAQDQSKCGTPNCILECSVCAGMTKPPTKLETKNPTTQGETHRPTFNPTKETPKPTQGDTQKPTFNPTKEGETKPPTKLETKTPTTQGETYKPTAHPTKETPKPTQGDTQKPTFNPTKEGETKPPTKHETKAPTKQGETHRPTFNPTKETPKPTQGDTQKPTAHPTKQGETKPPTKLETKAPTKQGETKAPTKQGETKAPTKQGETKAPTKQGETKAPSSTTNSTSIPTSRPTRQSDISKGCSSFTTEDECKSKGSDIKWSINGVSNVCKICSWGEAFLVKIEFTLSLGDKTFDKLDESEKKFVIWSFHDAIFAALKEKGLSDIIDDFPMSIGANFIQVKGLLSQDAADALRDSVVKIQGLFFSTVDSVLEQLSGKGVTLSNLKSEVTGSEPFCGCFADSSVADETSLNSVLSTAAALLSGYVSGSVAFNREL